MKSSGQANIEHFQQEVADLLELPFGSADAEVRKALLRKGGPEFLAWYDTRLLAIADSRQADLKTRGGKIATKPQ